MIREIALNGFKSKLENSKNNYPQSTNPNAPRFFFNLLAVASRGGSKTYTCTRLIKDFEENNLIDNNGNKHPLRTFLISPTISANKILRNLKSLEDQDMYEEYDDTVLKKIMDEIERTKEEVEKYKLYKNAYELIKRTPSNKIPDLMKRQPEIIKILEEYDFKHPNEIDIRFKEVPCNIILLDDLMGSSAFNRKSQSLLTYYLIKNRHHFVSFFILVQSMKSVPKAIRTNCNVFLLGKFASKKVVLEDMYEEVSNVLTEEQFENLYDFSTKDKYGCLIIDNSGESKRFYKSLDAELIVEDLTENKNNII
jgi:DNA-binding MarR family transcriptional regulator